MRWTRGLVLVLAVLSAAGAALLVRKSMTARAPVPERHIEPVREVLVMGRDAQAGDLVAEGDLRWRSWPANVMPAQAISRVPGTPGAHFAPAIARFPLMEGEPLAEAKLIRAGDGSAIAAMIGAGKRAIAVPVREESAAGGLLQPNDRVDLIWTGPSGDGPAQQQAARTLLRSVKVLAIGKAIQAGGRSVDGRTATLELTPAEARIVAGARASGEISLAIVPLAESPAAGGAPADEPDQPASVSILRFGR
jgi:pilus assembly protein CpaB